MSKHTPGKWITGKRRGSWDWVVAVEGGPLEICQMFHDGTEFNETGEANAHLVAAAPELLEACKAALMTLNINRRYVTCEPLESKLKAAIAKAEGAQ